MKIRQIVIRALCLLGLWLGLGLQAHAQTDTVTYVYTDPQGTPLVKADASGNIIARYDYTPYGNSIASLGAAPNGPGYTGHVNDPETGLVYMQVRYYQPFGRFLSPDPRTPSPGDVNNFNRYAYGSNNPVMNIDPNGEATVYYYSNGQVVIVQTFKNNGTQFTDEQISQEGRSLSGQTSDGRSISVVLIPGNDSDAVQINSNPKLNDLSPNGKDRTHTNAIGGRDIEVAPNAIGPDTIGHEFGHVLGAGDQYKGGLAANGKDYLKEDVPGPINIMKNAAGDANQQTRDEILKGTASPQDQHFVCTATFKGGQCQ